MNKSFTHEKLNSFTPAKQIKILYDLARFIETNQYNFESPCFKKLESYHQYLTQSPNEFIQKLHKEFKKIKALPSAQFQMYLMHLERFLGHSTKEYHAWVETKDGEAQKVKPLADIVCILDSIRSAHNVGAMIRNAECFGVEKMYLCGLTPKATHPSVIKTAMGCEKEIQQEYCEDVIPLLVSLKNEGYTVYGVETAKKARLLHEVDQKPQKIALILGNEQFGLSLDILKHCDELIKIQTFGSKNSLNVAITQGIVLQHFTSHS
ncbi:MAG: hypothetical protein CME62_07175 [Halobacteriovoraceae bacterium]|nr:hypothetical protein [Halobacteriovoraceae bacterium]|tara:strand:- start:9988 stop:10779 length:792 start_codon:yes stop_codon:yes gene_type:complete